MKDDPQTLRVYGWENRWIDYRAGKRLSEKEVRYWVNWACDLYGVKPPKVRFSRYANGGTSFYQPGDHYIEFRRRHMNIWSVLHEAAHAITDVLLGYDLDPHDIQWQGVFYALLLEALPHSARKHGLAPRPVTATGPKAIRRVYAAARRKRRHKRRKTR